MKSSEQPKVEAPAPPPPETLAPKVEAPAPKVEAAVPKDPQLFVRVLRPEHCLAVALPNGHHYTPDATSEFVIDPDDINWFKDRTCYQLSWR